MRILWRGAKVSTGRAGVYCPKRRLCSAALARADGTGVPGRSVVSTPVSNMRLNHRTRPVHMSVGLVGFLPGLLIYTVSYQFVSRSIESWFDVRVESALNAGLQLGRLTLDRTAADLGLRARSAARQLGEASDGAGSLTLERPGAGAGAQSSAGWVSA